jgi:hypothetical protein
MTVLQMMTNHEPDLETMTIIKTSSFPPQSGKTDYSNLSSYKNKNWGSAKLKYKGEEITIFLRLKTSGSERLDDVLATWLPNAYDFHFPVWPHGGKIGGRFAERLDEVIGPLPFVRIPQKASFVPERKLVEVFPDLIAGQDYFIVFVALKGEPEGTDDFKKVQQAVAFRHAKNALYFYMAING